MDPASSTPSTASPLIGQVVGGRYHIVGLIGEGGMGIVYKAEQRLGSTVRKVAVKTLHAELSRDPSITARFHREVGTVAQLEHPNTVRVYDFGSTDDGTLYIAMEFLDGKALNRVIESEGALEPRRVGYILRQVAGSLDEAHRQGIIHRDLKPENVLLIERAGEKDVVKLVDFGIAARTESAEREKEQKLTQQGMVLGTPPYMSPEQFTGKPLDARSDVYSLGVMVYEMLTGQLPFQADTAWQWATHHMTSPPRSFDETKGGGRIPEVLRRVVLKALSKEPSERQGSAGQFYTEFVASLGTPTSTLAPKPPPPAIAMDKTEAMPQVTPMAMAPTEGMPAAPAIASPPVALPRAPAPEPATNNKRLVYALSGVGAALLVAMGVVALSSGGGSDPVPPVSLGAPSAEPAPVTSSAPAETPTVTPEEPAPAPEEPSPAPTEAKPERPKPAATPKPATKPQATTPTQPAPAQTAPTPPPATTTPAPSPTPPAQTQPTPPVTQPTPPVAQPTPPVTQPAPQPAPTPPPAQATDACAACAKAAAARDILGAGRAYAQCANPSSKAQCAQRIGQNAPKAAEAAAFNGDCNQAKAIMAVAAQMGVPDSRLAKAKNACK